MYLQGQPRATWGKLWIWRINNGRQFRTSIMTLMLSSRWNCHGYRSVSVFYTLVNVSNIFLWRRVCGCHHCWLLSASKLDVRATFCEQNDANGFLMDKSMTVQCTKRSVVPGTTKLLTVDPFINRWYYRQSAKLRNCLLPESPHLRPYEFTSIIKQDNQARSWSDHIDTMVTRAISSKECGGCLQIESELNECEIML